MTCSCQVLRPLAPSVQDRWEGEFDDEMAAGGTNEV
jgi:hypothetical protein